MSPPYGIDKLRVYPSTAVLDIETLCRARGTDFGQVSRTLMTRERSVVPPWEDTVTLAINAAADLLAPQERDSVGLLVVATESSVDQEKPVSSWAHRWLGLPSNCRNFEIKHACYGGTAALRMALAWLREQNDDDCRAVVLSADSSLLGFGEPFEPVMGACGCAMLLSANPGLLELDPRLWGVYAHEVTDVIRPALNVETGNSQGSLFAYVEALEGAWTDFRRRTGGKLEFDSAFARHVYHLPFAGMGLQAHRTLASLASGANRGEALASYARRVEPSLRYGARIGSSYSASPYIALLSLLDHPDPPGPGDQISMFSYGSGSCAEFYAARFGPRARQAAADARLADLLDDRRVLGVAQYERSERARVAAIGAATYRPDPNLIEGLFESHYRGRGRLVLDGLYDYERRYIRA
jgi:3-hydroxy-3-methylglutaryl CoA synthase